MSHGLMKLAPSCLLGVASAGVEVGTVVLAVSFFDDPDRMSLIRNERDGLFLSGLAEVGGGDEEVCVDEADGDRFSCFPLAISALGHRLSNSVHIFFAGLS